MQLLDTSLTFDDILILPDYSEILPTDVSLETKFAKDLNLKIPIVSAAMDTVTESKLAQVIAQHGGLGVIHRNMSIESQAFEVEKVKKYESGMITDPITLGPDRPVREACDLMSKYKISGVPITDENRKLIGILTNRDLRFESNLDQPISNIMTKEGLITTKKGTTLEQARIILQKHRIEKLPVVDEQDRLTGLITIKDIEKAINFPLATKDSQGRLAVGAGLGTDDSAKQRASALVAKGVDALTVDASHGHSKNVLDMVKWLHSEFKDVIIVAGNVVTESGTLALIEAGADVIKVGVGPGSICTTRIVTGVGRPQLTALAECTKIAKKKGKTVIADGGIKYSGDITKALAIGADMAMIGSLFAGVAESPGDIILYQGRSYKSYRGMGSIKSMKKGSSDRYGQNLDDSSQELIPQGIEGRVPYKGLAAELIVQLIGGIKSGMGYVGASNISELQKKAKFVRISTLGLKESHVHTVSITKEAPNYRLS